MKYWAALTQRNTLFLLIGIYILVAITYAFIPGGALDMAALYTPGTSTEIPAWLMALAPAIFILVLYTPAGLVGMLLARWLGWPGIYRQGASRHDLFIRPLIYGAGAGLLLVIIDVARLMFTTIEGFPHPEFPASILASISAAIGEEIIFRLLLLSLWAVILSWFFRWLTKSPKVKEIIFWIANIIAALAFGAAHLGTAMILAGVSTPAELPAATIMLLFVLNGVIGLFAGWAFRRDGLVAAAGIHFWADVVWHVLYGLMLGLGLLSI